MMRLFKKVLAIVLAVNILTAFTIPVRAEKESEILRVAYYPLEGFFEYDSSGNEVGYGVELLNKISQYTGIKFEYVRAESWESTKHMLLDGEADLRMPATMPTTPSTSLSYSSSSILDTYNVMLTLDDREDLYYEDYDKIKTLKIAISENFYKVNAVQNYLDSIGVAENQLVFCDEYNECRDKLMSKEVDALITNIMDMESSMKMLVRFNNISNYFSMTINNPDLDTLDQAMADIKLDEPLCLSDLYEKWFPNCVTVPLTLQESEYLSSINMLTFAFQPNEGYLSHYENGIYYGIYTEIAKRICENLGVGYRAVSTLDCQNGKAAADVFTGFFYDQNYAEDCNLSLSTPLNEINYYIIQKKETKVDADSCKIAAIERFRYTTDYLQQKYKSARFVYFDTYEECLKAVANGQADMTVMNNYIAEYYLGMYQFSDLTARLSTEYSHLFCFAAADKNELLASILTKGIYMITDEEMNQLYILGQEQKPESNYIQAALYQNPMQFTMAIAGILVLVVGIIMLLLFVKKSKKQNRALASALSAKSTFLARMSHDMRTPMNGILGLSYLMEEQNDLKAVKEYIPQLRESGEYLLQLINDVLDVSRIESGKLTLHPQICSDEQLFASVNQMLVPLIEEKSIDFHFEKINIEWQYMMVDEQRVKQIFVNILSNAIKFTPKGGRIDFIMECVSRTESQVRNKFIVRDTGIGMSRELITHAFEPFWQEGRINTERSNGTGLGLPIVKQLVELMEGTITIKSECNQGTEVTVYINFPLAKAPREEKKSEAVPVQLEILKGHHILMCEDHPLNAQIAMKLLKRQGMEVRWAENGQVGLDAFLESVPGYYAAILMDIRMPVMDGLTAAKVIRSLDRTDAKTIPIIALTANAYDTDVQQALEAGINVYLAKPIEPQKLFEMLARQIKAQDNQ